MDQLAATLLAFPESNNVDYSLVDNPTFDANSKQHVSRLSKLLKDQTALLVIHGHELINLLDPAINTLSYIAVLHTLLLPSPASSIPYDILLNKFVHFLCVFDARQARYAKGHLYDILLAAGNGQYLPPSVAVRALATAILRLDPTGSILTMSHLNLAKLAYKTDNIEPALPVLDKNIIYFPGMASYGEPKFLCDLSLPPPAYLSRETGLATQLKPNLILEYDIFRGMSYCTLRDWAKAYDAFVRVITYPAREGSASKIMVEAYKKWVLVSLLSTGKLSELPSYTGAAASKMYGNLGKSYTALAVLFTADNAEALKAEVDKNAQTWTEDGNTGLVQEVLAAYQKWQVLGLEQIYSKISLAEIREQTTSAETGQALQKDEDVETLVQNMIISGMLNGVIEKNDDGTAFLTFLSPSAQLSEKEFAKELAGTAARLKQLQPIFKTTKERLGTSKEYIKHLAKEKSRADKSEPDPTLLFDAHVDDEDLMGGIVATG
ncbi:uncharacterized protein F4812DRAFT_435545 [Daldinia caldariorum]|uniref:uncharacterized protein n=1 Tax=Daldinia caldariorum TaxID=326644 RepID=UPI002007B3AA|nr:uncharacterized protein F4812DRAFT_435545 [Daldinia caldariorum]KAI1466009.1 hypothetical protein F4812DRAFT_435545 [Daldinia caldariorum]